MLSFLSRHAIPFAAGLICGGLLVSEFQTPVQRTSPNVKMAEEIPTLENQKIEFPIQSVEVPTARNAEIESAPNTPTQSNSTIPDWYRETIGPAVQPPTFGEKFKDFEAEPIDVPWAEAMEVGMNNFVAARGPDYGSVIEFIQCRTSKCVLAGYTIPNHEGLSASIIGELRRQSWWQGGGSSSSNLSTGDDRTSFVILIDRYIH